MAIVVDVQCLQSWQDNWCLLDLVVDADDYNKAIKREEEGEGERGYFWLGHGRGKREKMTDAPVVLS